MNETLQERAAAALQARNLERARIEAEQQELRVKNEISCLERLVARHSWLGADPEKITTPTIEVDGITIGGSGGHLVFLGKCPRCNEDCWSEGFGSIERLAELLEKFKPERGGHFCNEPASDSPVPIVAPTPTLGEQLEELVRQIAREEIENA